MFPQLRRTVCQNGFVIHIQPLCGHSSVKDYISERKGTYLKNSCSNVKSYQNNIVDDDQLG